MKEENKSKWLDAHHDPVASLYTFTQCLALSDIKADGDWKLVIGNLGIDNYVTKLKVFQGTTLIHESTLLDLPNGVVSFYMDTHEPRTPAIAVCSGPFIYVFKNLRPYYKFSMPTIDIDPSEQDLWTQVKQDKISPFQMWERLESLKNQGVSLTVRSLKFTQLDYSKPLILKAYVETFQDSPLKKQPVITCMNTLNKSSSDEDAVSCLVIGTENKTITILDPAAFTVLKTMKVPSVPVFLIVTGMFDVEYKIIASCRDGKIYIFKRVNVVPKLCIELSSQPVGMIRVNKNIVVGCMDETLQCISDKGKRLWNIKLPASVMTMELLDYTVKGVSAVLVALSNCTVHMYQDRHLVDVIQTPDVVNAMKFGRFGREEGNLILTTRSGGLIVKILRRHADLDVKDVTPGPPMAQNVKLNIPKKTKLFVNQSIRERENPVAMFRTFQRDLRLFRLNTARQFLHILENNNSPISCDPKDPLKISAQVQGIGPVFKLNITLQNTSLTNPSTNLCLNFDYNPRLYSFRKSRIPIPFLVPGLDYIFDILVDCKSEKGISDDIKVLLYRTGHLLPLLTAVISMPVSEAIPTD
ncbi:Bardet-Biedl syndrome 1 protein homolog isoform X1 [Octopus vulgaris]|uniref:Bardet-Biedl syndrome 1 protein homolog isoform X1 n=2 Tax=Octopus TaxID=6643 RepID=A0AA36BBU0_OCTVU|nr:Bardet-Biedl syndrome 1 protein [Octopus sinensis]CAI9730782.1 Bardet-Biedl syndrome 1 protein homolog isoform X1 [Octopus vulgaris]